MIVCYELFINGKIIESLKEVEDFVESMGQIRYKSMEQYSVAYDHILHSTYAFIATSIQPDNYNGVCNT